MKTKQDYVELEVWGRIALGLAPKWSPYRLIWKFTIWYARRMQRVVR